MNINCIQDDGQSLTPSDPNIDNEDTGKPTLVNAILSDNTPQSDESIDFSQTSEEDGTKGLYYTSTNTENNQRTYYFRGNVTNNYVYFANFYWRIVRINEDGSVRLIYQGTTPSATGSAATIGNSAFNRNSVDNAYVGYMYGTPGSSTYEETHANVNDSTIKMMLDTWCGDRSIAPSPGVWHSSDTALGYGRNITYYQINNRIKNTYQPQYSCPQSQDLYTTNSSGKGNKALEYPIGLITLDEVMYAGGTNFNSNESYYLYTGDYYWGITPFAFEGSYAIVGSVYSGGRLGSYLVYISRGVRPVINLVSGIEITGGDGTIGNEYIIKVS